MRHGGGEHLNVTKELGVSVWVGGVRREENRCRHRFELQVNAGLLRRLLDDLLSLLTWAVDRSLEHKLELFAALLTYAISTLFPASRFEHLNGFVNVEFKLGIFRSKPLWVVQKIGRGNACAPINEFLHTRAVHHQADGLSHGKL